MAYNFFEFLVVVEVNGGDCKKCLKFNPNVQAYLEITSGSSDQSFAPQRKD